MFCLADVCKALGIDNSRNVKSRLNCGYVHTIDTSTKSKNSMGVQSHGDIDYTAALKKLNQWIRNNTELSARLAATGYIATQRR